MHLSRKQRAGHSFATILIPAAMHSLPLPVLFIMVVLFAYSSNEAEPGSSAVTSKTKSTTKTVRATLTQPDACTFTLSGGAFASQKVRIAHPKNITSPGAATSYWSQRPSVGTELDASHERPVGIVLHVPAAGRNKTGTFPLAAGYISNSAGGPAEIILNSGTVMITNYGSRLVGTFKATGMYIDMQRGIKQVPVTVSNGSFDLNRGSDR